MSIATEILRQLGGRQAQMMMGMKNVIDTGNGLSFRFGKNASKANYCKITLNHNDLYTIELGRIHGLNYKELDSAYGIFAENMVSYFENFTKLYLSL